MQHADGLLKGDKDVAIAAVQENGNALEHASELLKGDKDVVMAALQENGAALKFAKPPLNQDIECMKVAGLFEEDVSSRAYGRPEKAVLSVKFSQGVENSPFATEFRLAMKEDPFLKEFWTYYPNAWCKKSCDPAFTDINHPCRGSSSTCNFPMNQNRKLLTGRPHETSCWRFAFRFQLEEARDKNGFMVQVEEPGGLGNGQKIETEIAKEVGIKVFRTYTFDRNWGFEQCDLKNLSKTIKDWYMTGCTDTDFLENVWIGQFPIKVAVESGFVVERPRLERL